MRNKEDKFMKTLRSPTARERQLETFLRARFVIGVCAWVVLAAELFQTVVGRFTGQRHSPDVLRILGAWLPVIVFDLLAKILQLAEYFEERMRAERAIKR